MDTAAKNHQLPTIERYVGLVLKTFECYPSWRIGQAYFNVLAEVRPDLAEMVRTTENDTFYRDERVPAFMDWLKGNWDNWDLDVHAWYKKNGAGW